MKKVKKLVACVLAAAIISNLSVPVLAAKATEETYDYIGSNETILATSNEVQQKTRNSEPEPEIVITYIEDKDKNHQIFTYRDGELVEIVYGGIGATEIRSQTIVNGEVVSENTMDVEVEEIVQPSLYAYKKQGIIEHENAWTGDILGITLYLDTYSVTKNATIKTGVYTFAQIASWLLSAWALPSLGSANAISQIIFGNAIITAGLEIILMIVVKLWK